MVNSQILMIYINISPDFSRHWLHPTVGGTSEGDQDSDGGAEERTWKVQVGRILILERHCVMQSALALPLIHARELSMGHCSAYAACGEFGSVAMPVII